MRNFVAGALFALSVVYGLPVVFAQNGEAPTIAFDITKSDIDYVLKNAPPNPPDRQLRIVDMGKYNLGRRHHPPRSDQRQARRSDSCSLSRLHARGVHHHVRIGRAHDRRRDQQQAGRPGHSECDERPERQRYGGRRRIPPGRSRGRHHHHPNKVAHGWSQVTDHIEYLSVRPDPDRVLPSGYVYPLLLKNLPAPAQVPAAASGGRGAGTGRGAAPAPGLD
mgnify:CR=1 FL=1